MLSFSARSLATKVGYEAGIYFKKYFFLNVWRTRGFYETKSEKDWLRRKKVQ